MIHPPSVCLLNEFKSTPPEACIKVKVLNRPFNSNWLYLSNLPPLQLDEKIERQRQIVLAVWST